MNPNPYPAGRWTSRRKAAGRSLRSESESITSLRQAPLRELFWGLPESQLLEEARQRIESALLAALNAVPIAPFETADQVTQDLEPEAALA